MTATRYISGVLCAVLTAGQQRVARPADGVRRQYDHLLRRKSDEVLRRQHVHVDAGAQTGNGQGRQHGDGLRRSKNGQGLSLAVLFLLISLMADEAPSRREDLAKHTQRQGGGDAYVRIRGV